MYLLAVTGETLQASGNGPGTQPRDMVQPQDLSYFTHGQPLVRHRNALPEIPRESHGRRLSRVTALRGSDLMHRCDAHRKVSRFPPESPTTLRRNQCSPSTGMTDHFGPEYAGIDPAGKKVTLEGGATLGYDMLVVWYESMTGDAFG